MRRCTINCHVAITNYKTMDSICLAYGKIKSNPFLIQFDAENNKVNSQYDYERWISLGDIVTTQKKSKKYKLSVFDVPARALVCDGVVLSIAAMVEGNILYYEITRTNTIIKSPH